MRGKSDKAETQKQILYYLIVLILIYLYATYVPYLLDYYLVRPELSFLSFMYDRGDIANPIYGYESVVLGLVLGLLYCLTANVGVSISILSVAMTFLTHASYLKYMNRKELLRLDDLRITEAAGMAAEYLRIGGGKWFGILVGCMLLFAAAGIGTEIFRKRMCRGCKEKTSQSLRKRMRRLRLRAAGVAACGAACYLYSGTFFAGQLSMRQVDNIQIVDPDDNRYVLYRFLQNDKLANVSADDARECYEDLLTQSPARETELDASTRKPNLIVVMNESWWNTDHADPEKVTFSMDPMGPIKELEGKCTLGHLTTNVYGGGTVSSEAEFLTALNTKYFVNDSTVFKETMGRKLPSVVDYLKSQDYVATAIHPYYGEFYDRDRVYEKLGFDRTVFEKDMDYRDIYSKFISDESAVKQIIHEYEAQQKSGRSQFIWTVTIANHVKSLEYESAFQEGYDYPIEVRTKDVLKASQEETLVNYVNGIYLASEAFAQLVGYFEQCGEPTVVIMFGDHCPGFRDEMIGALGLDTEDDSQEMLEKLYSVPIVCWSNLEGDAELYFDGEGIYYVPGMLLEYAGLPDCDMMRIRRLERTQFLANTRKLVLGADGKKIERCTEEQMHILNEVRAVQYDIMLGEQKCMEIWDAK